MREVFARSPHVESFDDSTAARGGWGAQLAWWWLDDEPQDHGQRNRADLRVLSPSRTEVAAVRMR